MAAESASNNDNVPLHNGNGNIPTPPSMTPPKPTLHTPEGLLTTIVLTIYDVIIFLAVSIGYIFQVSAALYFPLSFSSNISKALEINIKFYSPRPWNAIFNHKSCYRKTFIRMDSHLIV